MPAQIASCPRCWLDCVETRSASAAPWPWALEPHSRFSHSLVFVCSSHCSLTHRLVWEQVRHWGLSNETTFGVCKMAEVAAKLGVPPPISIQAGFGATVLPFRLQCCKAKC